MQNNTKTKADILREAIRALQAYYIDNRATKTLEYDYGYFDAVGVIEQLIEKGI